MLDPYLLMQEHINIVSRLIKRLVPIFKGFPTETGTLIEFSLCYLSIKNKEGIPASVSYFIPFLENENMGSAELNSLVPGIDVPDPNFELEDK